MSLDLVLDILIATVPLLVIFPTLFAFTTWLERKALARIQNRVGPDKVGVPLTRYGGRFSLFGLGQPMADGIKMLFKENIVPRDADRLFHLLAPILALIPAMLVLCFLPLEFPWAKSLQPVQAFLLDGAVIFFFAITGLNTLAVFMAGWASRNKYSLLGGMRAIAQMVSYEIPLVLSAVVVVMMVGDLNAKEIADFQTGGKWIVGKWFLFTPWGLAAFIIFFIASLAETNRSPFDLPEAESEIIAGYFTEYSGFKFALFFLGEYIAMFAISGLAVTLFLGGGSGPGVAMNLVDQGLATERWGTVSAFPGLAVIWFLVKIFAIIAVMIWLRGTLPRLRVDQLMGFAWKFLLPLSILNILVAGFAHFIPQENIVSKVAVWVVSLGILYTAAKGLNQLNRLNVRPREYKYAE